MTRFLLSLLLVAAAGAASAQVVVRIGAEAAVAVGGVAVEIDGTLDAVGPLDTDGATVSFSDPSTGGITLSSGLGAVLSSPSAFRGTAVTGSVQVGGSLRLTLDPTMPIGAGDTFDVLTCSNGCSGTFAAVTSPLAVAVTYVSDAVTVEALEGYTPVFALELPTAGWRTLAAPAAGLDLGDVLGPIWTQGFPGADADDGDPNVYAYAEATAGAADVGFTVPGSQSEAWAVGTGRFVYVFADDDADGTADPFPKLLDVGGTAQSGPFDLPLSFTDHGDPDGDGWNLMGNPFATALDWDDVTFSGGVDETVYVYDPAYSGGGYRAYVGGVGPLPGGRLSPGQGFFVHATSAGASITATASSGTGPGVYRRPGAAPDGLVGTLRFEVRDGDAVEAEAFVAVRDDPAAALALDPLDGYALDPFRASFVRLATEPAEGDGARLAVQSVPSALTGGARIPLVLEAVGDAPRTLTLAWDAAALPAGGSARLVDRASGASADLSTAGEIVVEVGPGARGLETPGLRLSGGGSARVAPARFEVVLAALAVSSEDAPETALSLDVWPNPAVGAASVVLDGTADRALVEVYDVVGRRVAVLHEGPLRGRTSRPVPVADLAPGVYVVRASAAGRVVTGRFTVVR